MFDNVEFSFDSEKENEIEQNIIIPDTHFEIVNYDYAIEFVKSLDLKSKKEQVGFLTGKFIAGDIFEAFVDYYNISFKELTISSLSMNENNIDSFKTLLLNGSLEKLTLIVSDFWYSHAKHKLLPYLVQEFEGHNVEFAIVKTHTKIFLLETQNNKFIFEGSANLNSSNNIEQYRLSFNQEVYNFYYEKLHKLKQQFFDNNKQLVKHKNLWEVVKNG